MTFSSDLGHLCGYCSSIIWLIVLFPQFVKNFKRKSVDGLSLFGLQVNFTASLINVFFTYAQDLPLFYKFMGTYMPMIESGMLMQFYYYDRKKTSDRFWNIKWIIGLFMWISILFSQFYFDISSQFQWVAIILWCVNGFPQIFLNNCLESTEALARLSIFMAYLGKTSDFGSAFLLDMPTQVVTLAYMSSTLAFINTTQVLFFGNGTDEKITLFRRLGIGFLSIELIGMVVALLFKRDWRFMLLPIIVIVVFVCNVIWNKRSSTTVEEKKPLISNDPSDLLKDISSEV